MAKSFNSLMKKLPPWFMNAGDEEDVIIGTMARVVRNLAGHTYPGWSTEEGRKAVADKILPVIQKLPGNKTAAYYAEMTNLSYTQRRVLLERKQISQCMAARQSGCHIVINGKQDTTFMVNEEEHLVMHLFSSESQHQPLIQKAEKICATLAKELKFAENAKGEQLTSLPAESGSGIQLYTVMQLPALVMADMMPQINRGLEKLMLNIAPLYSHMGDDAAYLFVIYTAPILVGGTEEIANHLYDVALTIAEREHEVRSRLVNNAKTMGVLPDAVSRAYGLLRYSCRLEYAECINALCMLRLGLIAGFVEADGVTLDSIVSFIATYYIATAPYHMRYLAPESTETAIELARSSFCKQLIAQLELTTDFFGALIEQNPSYHE